MKANVIMRGDVTSSLTTYFKQCSMMVTAVSLANLGAVLANNGVKPWDQDRLISSQAATYAKSLMMMTGLYNESGTYSSIIGVPTKSGLRRLRGPEHRFEIRYFPVLKCVLPSIVANSYINIKGPRAVHRYGAFYNYFLKVFSF